MGGRAGMSGPSRGQSRAGLASDLCLGKEKKQEQQGRGPHGCLGA